MQFIALNIQTAANEMKFQINSPWIINVLEKSVQPPFDPVCSQ